MTPRFSEISCQQNVKNVIESNGMDAEVKEKIDVIETRIACNVKQMKWNG